MGYETIIFQKMGAVGKITLHRPDRLNAINSAMGSEIGDLLEKVSADDGIRALVITGSPRIRERNGCNERQYCFSAGWDLAEAGPVESVPGLIAALEKPIIAMVNGLALGGGCVIALACDFTYVTDISELGLPEINRGILPAWGGTQLLSRRIGLSRAKRMIFTGKSVSGKEAAAIGLADLCVPVERLEKTVMSFAGELASKAPLALRQIKRVMDLGSNTDLESGLQYELEAFGFLTGTEDFLEGLAAFAERREPFWRGK